MGYLCGMIPWIPLLVTIIGLIVYVVGTNAKVSEIGRIGFAFGLLSTLLSLARYVITA